MIVFKNPSHFLINNLFNSHKITWYFFQARGCFPLRGKPRSPLSLRSLAYARSMPATASETAFQNTPGNFMLRKNASRPQTYHIDSKCSLRDSDSAYRGSCRKAIWLGLHSICSRLTVEARARLL